MRVLGVDIEDVAPEPGVEAIWKPDRLGDLLGASDAVVICLPLTKATHHLFTRDLFRKMKKTGYLINVTRGAIVYGDDLLKAASERWPSYLAYVVSFSTVGRAVASTQCDHQRKLKATVFHRSLPSTKKTSKTLSWWTGPCPK